jgi:hypothetical protein
MLVTNSEERATIQQIYADKWFRTDLPEYLIPSEIAQLATPEGAEKPLDIDPKIVTKVAEVLPPRVLLTVRISAPQSKMF